MLRAGRAQIDPGGVDGAVPQHVGQLYDVAGGLIEGGGEQMPQIMGKDLRSRHARFFAQSFQDPPDGLSGEGPAVFGEEDLTGGDFLFSGEPEQLPAQFFGQEDGADFSLQRDIGPPGPTGLHHRNSA